MNSAVVPAGIGRIPHKIMSGLSSLTADQLKNWVIDFSILSLRDILTGDNLECWRHFVLACRILCSQQLTKEKILLADALLLQFCWRTQRLYGSKYYSQHTHALSLKRVHIAYGPLHGFGLFSFERYNGLLGELPHNSARPDISPDSSGWCIEMGHQYSIDLTSHF